jgi:hypothetical protein
MDRHPRVDKTSHPCFHTVTQQNRHFESNCKSNFRELNQAKDVPLSVGVYDWVVELWQDFTQMCKIGTRD